MFKEQLFALLWRNFLIKKKRKGRTISEIALPTYMIVLLVILQKTIVTQDYPEIKDPRGNLSLWNPNPSDKTRIKGTVGIVPDNEHVRSITNSMKTILANTSVQITIGLYNTTEDLLEAYLQNDSSLIAGVIFSNNPKENGSYLIKLPFEEIPSPDSHYSTPADCRDLNSSQMYIADIKCSAIKYYTSGFSYLQAVVDSALLTFWNGEISSVPNSKISIYPKTAYKSPGETMRIILPLYLVISLSPVVSNLIIIIVYEKEKKIKEGMLIMGMLQSSFWLSWFIIEAALILVLTILIAVIISVASVLPNTNAFIVFLLMFLYGLSLIMFAFMLTPFFNKSKVAGSVVGFIVALFSVVHLLAVYLKSQLSNVVFYLLALLSPAACGLGLEFVVDMEMSGYGVSFNNLFDGKFSSGMAIVMLVIDILLYGLLALYFDLVIPGEFGPRHPPWFFLLPSYWTNKKMSHIATLEELTSTNEDDIEHVPAHMHDKEAIIINNIKKTYTKCRKGEVKAVDGVNLKIYEDQITALLGHNGAGKTTLMNVLVGMTPPTSGSAHVFGLNIANARDQSRIRMMTGICMQENILIDELSCRDHLMFFAKLKCVPKESCQGEVDQILADLCLMDCQNTDSKSLSGGQKRKLCVGIALIGDPKIIFLDEPSSGVDPYSRRQMWSLLQKKKQGRVVVLTTHFMDEADILADRKAIMSRGKIRCAGSSFFLKNKFGIGYHLILEVDSTNDKNSISNIVRNHIPSASFSRISASELSYLLPLNQTEKFPGLFSAIEEACSTNLHGMKSYGVSMTTLEEVFIALGEENMEEQNGEYITGTNNENEVLTQDSRAEDFVEDAECKPSFQQTFYAFMKIRLLLLLRSPKHVAAIVISPILIMLINYFLLNSANPTTASDAIKLNPSLYTPSFHVKLQNKTGSHLDKLESYFADMKLDVDLVSAMSLSDLQSPSYMAIAMEELDAKAKSDISWSWYFNDTAIHYLPIVQNAMTNFYGGLLNKSKIKSLEVSSEPFPKKSGQETIFNGLLYTWTLLLSTILAILPTTIAVEVVEDREAQIKNQLRVSGLSFGMYWLMTTLAHSLVLFLPIAVLVIGIIAMNILDSGMATFAVILLCLLFIPSSLIYTYVITFMFDRHDTAKSVMPTISFFISFIPMIVVFMVDVFAKSASTILHVIFSILSPLYSPTGGMYFIIQVNQELKFLRSMALPADESTYFVMSNNVTPTIIIMIANTFLYLFLLRIAEVLKSGGNLKDAFFLNHSGQKFTLNPNPPQDEDIDVKAERDKVLNAINAQQQPVLLIQELGKNYFKTTCGKRTSLDKIAVHNLNLSVDSGHIFGLLGPNGAGKTSTMKIVIAEESPTYGKVSVAGYNITSNLSEAFKLIGYCPQHDALWNNITLEEHIRLYAGIRGIHSKELDGVCTKLMSALNIEEHAKKQAKELSGGTKRKLLYIISIIGRPQLVLLDEPSTGMDPQSKRFLWNTICSAFPANGGRTVVLTTHSMEEADILCTQIGIMVNGLLTCIGSSQHLKNKYGGGYTLDMKIEDINKMPEVTNFIARIFPSSSQQESFGNRIAFAIPKEGVLSAAQAFASIEKAKEDLGVEEYSLSQTSLEQVFLQFARQQKDLT